MTSIKRFISITIILFMSMLFSACLDRGESPSTGSASTEPLAASEVIPEGPIKFQMFPPNYFNGDYFESFSFDGSFSNGLEVTATLECKSSKKDSFNSQPAIGIEEYLSIKNSISGERDNSLSETFYSTDMDNLMYLGDYTITYNITSKSTTSHIIPLSASIGDSGTIASYANSDWSTATTTWSIEDGTDGKAKLVTTSKHYDKFRKLENTTVESKIIRQDGTIDSINLVVKYHQMGNIVFTLNGVRD